jgi:hypothetical protein
MNIYQMYEYNGDRAGFWVRRDTWGNTIAKVVLIGALTEGKLPGRAPYYGNPPVQVEIYNLHSGERLDYGDVLRCPGTGSYRMVNAPSWANEASS